MVILQSFLPSSKIRLSYTAVQEKIVTYRKPSIETRKGGRYQATT
jgi:hypothetical protein